MASCERCCAHGGRRHDLPTKGLNPGVPFAERTTTFVHVLPDQDAQCENSQSSHHERRVKSRPERAAGFQCQTGEFDCRFWPVLWLAGVKTRPRGLQVIPHAIKAFLSNSYTFWEDRAMPSRTSARSPFASCDASSCHSTGFPSFSSNSMGFDPKYLITSNVVPVL